MTERWERLDEARTWKPVREAFVDRGHGAGDYLASVRVEPALSGQYGAWVPGATWPKGAAVALFLEQRVTGDAASIYAMTKREDGNWEYVVARPDGLIEARGPLTLCARCHAEAASDSLFGPPTEAPESVGPPQRF